LAHGADASVCQRREGPSDDSHRRCEAEHRALWQLGGGYGGR